MRRSIALIAALLSLASLGAVAHTDPWEKHDYMIPMSDGVVIDASVYIPSGTAPAGGYPLIVRQHGGGSNKDSVYDVHFGVLAVETGNFALLMYSHRGHGSSGGLFDFFGPRTTQDFSEVLDFVRDHEPAVNTNNVGTDGYSQGGGESLLPAENDPRVKAVAVGNTFDDLNHALNPNDCFKFSFATGIFALAYKSSASKTDDVTALRWGAQLNTDTEDTPIPALGLTAGSGQDPISTTDDLTSRSPLTYVRPDASRPMYANGLHVPTYWSQSWEDNLFPGDHSLAILDDLRSRDIPVHYYFSSGGHEVPGGDNQDDQTTKEFGMLTWFDEFLRGVDHGYASGAAPMVGYAQRIPDGTGWDLKTATDWPIPVAPDASLIPLVGGTLCVVQGSGGCAGPSGNLAQIANDLVSANVATDPILHNRVGITDGVPDSANSLDTATFLSAPLGASLSWTGSPHVHLQAATNAPSVAQVDVKIWDSSNGNRTLVSRGCKSVQGNGFDFDLWPNSHVFPAGHQVVLTVSTVDFPTFKPDVEPQTTVLEYGSEITLPGIGT